MGRAPRDSGYSSRCRQSSDPIFLYTPKALCGKLPSSFSGSSFQPTSWACFCESGRKGAACLRGALPCSPHHPTTGTQGKAAGVYLGFERAKLGSAGGFPLRKRIHKYNTNLGMKTNIYLEGERKSPQSPGALGVQVPFFRHLFRQVTRHSWLFSPPRTLCDPQDPPPLTGAQAKRRS